MSVPAGAEPVFFFHVAPLTYSPCQSFDDFTANCSSLKAVASGNEDVLVWVLVGDIATDIGGAIFGVDYHGINVETWTLCNGGAQIPSVGWPSSGSGLSLTWPQGCYRPSSSTRMAKVGFFYVRAGSSGNMRFIPDPRGTGAIRVVDCTSAGTDACEYNGVLALGNENGYVPANCGCSGPQVLERTWSAIKNSYRTP